MHTVLHTVVEAASCPTSKASSCCVSCVAEKHVQGLLELDPPFHWSMCAWREALEMFATAQEGLHMVNVLP